MKKLPLLESTAEKVGSLGDSQVWVCMRQQRGVGRKGGECCFSNHEFLRAY